MNLTVEQEALVRQWVAEGASLSDVQKNIRAEFGMHPTFFDVRMLVMNLGAQIRDKEVQVAADLSAPSFTVSRVWLWGSAEPLSKTSTALVLMAPQEQDL